MASYTVLICDDNPAIANSLASYFIDDGMTVITTAYGKDALNIFNEHNVDVIVQDIMLPDISGLDVCKEIRKVSDVPILILSAKDGEEDRILGLELCDDYVTKPFSPHEVFIRCKKMLDRKENKTFQKKYEVEDLLIYPDKFETYVAGKKIQLTAKEFIALKYLVAHEGKVMTRDHIINIVWGSEYAGEPRIVDTLITRLRKKIFSSTDKELHFDIITVFGVGYKFEVK